MNFPPSLCLIGPLFLLLRPESSFLLQLFLFILMHSSRIHTVFEPRLGDTKGRGRVSWSLLAELLYFRFCFPSPIHLLPFTFRSSPIAAPCVLPRFSVTFSRRKGAVLFHPILTRTGISQSFLKNSFVGCKF